MKKTNFKIAITITAVAILLILFAQFQNGHKPEKKTNPKEESLSRRVKKVSVIDFSNMGHSEIVKWCSENNIICKEKTIYSESVAKGGFVSQLTKAKEEVEEGSTIYILYSRGKSPTASQLNALKQAESYLKHSSFSREGLINQLMYEEYSKEDAIYAVDNVSVDWNEQAAKRAKSYLSHSAFSRGRLIKQLEYEKFTKSQAEYGVNKAGL